MTVHGSSAAAETCSLTGCCHAVQLMTDCSILWARGRRSCVGPLTSVGAYSLQVYTSSRYRPQSWAPLKLSPPARQKNSCRYGAVTPCMHFPKRTAVLKMILRHTGSQWRLRRTGVMWSRRRAADKRAAVFCSDCSRFI